MSVNESGRDPFLGIGQRGHDPVKISNKPKGVEGVEFTDEKTHEVSNFLSKENISEMRRKIGLKLRPKLETSNPIFKPITSNFLRTVSGKSDADRAVGVLTKTGKVKTKEEKKEISKKMKATTDFIQKNRKSLINAAGKNGKTVYLKPADIETIMKTRMGENATYEGFHVQINPDGTMYIIPKREELGLGSGTYKKVKLAIELDKNGKPKRPVAFARISMKKLEAKYRERGHLKQGQDFEPYKEQQFDEICKEVGMVRDLLETTREDLGFAGSDIKLTAYAVDGTFTKATIVSPYCNFGDLDQKIPEEHKFDAMFGALDSVKEMHDEGFVNGDIKPENFLGHIAESKETGPKLIIKCFDVGLSYEYHPEEGAKYVGSPIYMAPEMFTGSKNFDPFKADVFSLGVTLYQMKNYQNKNQKGFPKIIHSAFGKGVRRGDAYQVDLQKEWDNFQAEDSFEVLFKAMIHPNPEKRPDLDSVKKILIRIQNNEISDPADLAAELGITQGPTEREEPVIRKIAQDIVNKLGEKPPNIEEIELLIGKVETQKELGLLAKEIGVIGAQMGDKKPSLDVLPNILAKRGKEVAAVG